MTNSDQKIERRPYGVALAAAGALLLSGAALAKPSSPSEIRGYHNCVDAAVEQTKTLRPTRQYLLETNEAGRTYFINAYQWQNGEHVPVRVACSTSRNGHKLQTVAVNEGRYSNQNTRVTIEVARK